MEKNEIDANRDYDREIRELQERERKFASMDQRIMSGDWPGSDKYVVDKVIGRGSFGSVFAGWVKGTSSSEAPSEPPSAAPSEASSRLSDLFSLRLSPPASSQPVAIKVVHDVFESGATTVQALRELSIHMHVDSRWGDNGDGECDGCSPIPRLIDVGPPASSSSSCAFDCIYVVMEQFDCTLHHALEGHQTGKRPLTQTAIRRVCEKIASCVAKLHECGVVHRDLKPQNFLVRGRLEDETCKIVVCDLGMARLVSSSSMPPNDRHWSDYVTTRWYRAPEVCCHIPVDARGAMAADVWSLGCLLLETMTGRAPVFGGQSEVNQARIMGDALLPHQFVTGSPVVSQWYRLNARNERAVNALLGLPGEEGQPRVERKHPLHALHASHGSHGSHHSHSSHSSHSVLPMTSSLASMCRKLPVLAQDLVSRILHIDPAARLTSNEILRHDYFVCEDARSSHSFEQCRDHVRASTSVHVPFTYQGTLGALSSVKGRDYARSILFKELDACVDYIRRRNESAHERQAAASPPSTTQLPSNLKDYKRMISSTSTSSTTSNDPPPHKMTRRAS